MPRIPFRIPARLGGLSAGAFVPSSTAWDVIIGGIPFLAGQDDSDPHIRETAQWRKDQQDQSVESGEQSLGGWWYRSQSSFHGGAGLTYLETPGDNAEGRIRFDDSFNVDPWTPGVLRRLPDTTLALASGATGQKLAAARMGTVDYLLHAAGTTLKTVNIPDGGGAITTTTVTWSGAGSILALATDGRNYYVADTAGVWKGPVDNSSIGVKIWDLSSPPSVVLAWVKHRLIAGVDRKIYELSGTGPALPATANYTHPTTGWAWTAISEDPGAVLAAGYAGGQSGIMRFELDTSGVVPTLTGGSEVAQLPAGEIVRSLRLHAGSFLAIGTSRGLRVGTFDTYSGGLKYGPLTLDLEQPVLAVTARGDFLYAGGTAATDGESGMIRVDLGRAIDEAGHLAWASDLLCDAAATGAVSGADVTVGGRLAFCVDGRGVILEGVGPGSARPAWLRTSRIRFSTAEPKVFRFGQVTGEFEAPARLDIVLSSPGLADRTVLTWQSASDPEQFGLADGPRKWIQLRFELTGAGAELGSYTVKALPAVRRQRILQYVLLCNDREADRNGQEHNQTGFAWERIQRLEELEDSGDEVSVQELLPGIGPITRRCVIDRVTYRQSSRPTRIGGRGGVLLVLARTVS